MALTTDDLEYVKLAADDRLLFDNGLIYLNGSPTESGWQMMKQAVFDANKADLVKSVKAIKKVKASE